MARRYSGNLRITVTWLDAESRYRATVTGPDGRFTAAIWSAPVEKLAVDCPEAFDRTARTALAFAEDERSGFCDGADMDDSGYVVRRSKGVR